MESCFGDVLIPYSDLMVPRVKISLGKVFGTPQFVHEFINPRDGIPVFNGLFVECSIVDAHLQCTILLLDQDH